MAYIYLILAIIFEVVGTASLKASVGFTKLWPSMSVLVSYVLSFYFLSLILNIFPIGITYAIWSGLGIVLLALIGIVVFGQTPDLPAVLGMLLILLGVVVIFAFSKTTNH